MHRSTRLAVTLGVAALALAAGSLLISAPAQAAGRLELRFEQPENFTDAGRGALTREATLHDIGRHFERLAERLPDGQTLSVTVLDIDLAGEVWPFAPSEVRVLRGRVDWPHLNLRYRLLQGETVLAEGEERLSDPSYLFFSHGLARHGALPYERRMLEHWFNERFAASLR